jgi:hypothetical protein
MKTEKFKTTVRRDSHLLWLAPPLPGLSPKIKLLARDPNKKIAAIKLYRDANPGVGLREAKLKIEEFCKSNL